MDVRAALRLAIVTMLIQGGAAAQEHEHAGTAPGKVGTVHFATSCRPAAAPQFDRAVALLHSFEFGAAIDAFTRTQAIDPRCAVTEWGIALSRWGNPFAVAERPPALLQQGRDAVDRREGRDTDD